MSNYVIVEFDNTPPVIKIHAPRFTTRSANNIIIIESNENLSEYQDIYAIDKNGSRHDFTFARESEKKYLGNLKFENFPIGITNIHARMKDDVDNYSNLVIHSINILESIRIVHAKTKDVEKSKVSADDRLFVDARVKQHQRWVHIESVVRNQVDIEEMQSR